MRLNPRDIQKAMQRFGIQQQDIPAKRVIIEQEDKNLVINDPKVAKVNMMGEEVFQVSGEITEEEKDTKPEIDEEDIKTVMEQAKATKEEAKTAIEEAGGDLAKAILKLTGQ
ncbi:nascent polypeptide-associated complex protein [Candidatus Woesearchaeota archaeon]|nr:MAG: nascent polypeptide-associated complex protein [Candidatus Woesearchaeota archaeon]